MCKALSNTFESFLWCHFYMQSEGMTRGQLVEDRRRGRAALTGEVLAAEIVDP